MIKKIWQSFIYSCHGIRATFIKEYSFRIEISLLLIVIGFLILINLSPCRKIIMLASYCFIPCLELLNSAIEKLADRLTTDHDLTIQFVKDAASAAVMVSIIIVVLIWIACIWF
jgi:diacylglycerol kinase (ATP)